VWEMVFVKDAIHQVLKQNALVVFFAASLPN
jgi:hypothetical protein